MFMGLYKFQTMGRSGRQRGPPKALTNSKLARPVPDLPLVFVHQIRSARISAVRCRAVRHGRCGMPRSEGEIIPSQDQRTNRP